MLESTEYFRHTRQRPDRVGIRDEWIQLAVGQPVAETVQGERSDPAMGVHSNGRAVSPRGTARGREDRSQRRL